MTWQRGKFGIADRDETGKGMVWKTVSGWTHPVGLGLHIETEGVDELGRNRWNVTHLPSGIFFLYFNANEKLALELGDLIAMGEHYADFNRLQDLMAADPLWKPRLLGLKHTVGFDLIEFPVPEMNDPEKMVWISADTADGMTKQ